MSVASVCGRINDKDEKIVHYAPLDEQWLIIVQNSFLMSSLYNPDDVKTALNHKYRSRFDRIFVFERSEGTVTELKIEKKA